MAISKQLLFRAGEIKQPKRREALIENAEKARISRQLVLLDDKVELDVPLDDLAVHEPDARKLIAFLKAMEFSTLTRRVADYSQIDPADVEADAANKQRRLRRRQPAQGNAVAATIGDLFARPAARPPRKRAASKDDKAASLKGTPVSLAAARERSRRARLPVDRGKYQTIRTLDRAERLDRARPRCRPCSRSRSRPTRSTRCRPSSAASRWRWRRTKPATCRSAHSSPAAAAACSTPGLAPDQIKARDALAALQPMLESAGVLKIGFNIKFTAVMLAQHGITLAQHRRRQLMSYVLDAGRGSHKLDALAERWLGHAILADGELIGSGKNKLTFDQVAIDEASDYSAEAADMIAAAVAGAEAAPRRRAHDRGLRDAGTAAGLGARAHGAARHLDRPPGAVAAVGRFRPDRSAASKPRSRRSRASRSMSAARSRSATSCSARWALPGGTKTKTGAWSTSAPVLDELAEQGHELPKKILEWRQVSKLKSTYTDALPTYVNPQTHRVHTTYALAATTTGRLSSNEPNLQNIPVRTEDGRKIRRAFIATPGHKLVSADYSQIELRLLAEIADIPVLKQAFRDGLDIHAMTASEMFGVPIKDMPSEVRRRAKAINFGIIYGISAFGLANQLGIAARGGRRLHQEIFRALPRHPRLHGRDPRVLPEPTATSMTLFGRKCHYPDIKASNASVRAFNERAAINARLQGSAADIIRRAMTRMEDALPRRSSRRRCCCRCTTN